MLKPANYSNLKNYAFDENYSNLENYARGLPINKIAPMLCIHEIFTDNFVVSWASKDLKAGCVERPKKELAMEVTSKELCRCVWLVTSVD
jgi:hypothetical protein